MNNPARVSILAYRRKPYPQTILLVLSIISIFISCKREIDTTANQLEVSLKKPGFQQEFIRLSAITTNYTIPVTVNAYPGIKLSYTANFRVDPNLLTAYNVSTGSHFELLPDSTYLIADSKVVFQPGQNTTQLPVQIQTKKINPYIKYVLPVKIESSDVAVNSSANVALLRVV